MNFWERIQKDLSENLKEGLEIVKEGSEAVTQKLEKLTEVGKNKYKVFNFNMKVQDEFAKLGGQIYDLTIKKSKNPLGNRKVISVIKKINRLEAQITKLEGKETGKRRKTTAKKTRRKSTAKTKSRTAKQVKKS